MALTGLLYAKDPRFDSQAFSVLSIFANSLIQVYPKTMGTEYTWDPKDGNGKDPVVPLWRGWATVTPNKDWRARDRRWAYEDTATHAYRVQLWHRKMNLLYPRDQWETAPLPLFEYGQTVRVLEHPSDPTYVGLLLSVRNAVTDSDQWQPTLLCDVSTGDPIGV